MTMNKTEAAWFAGLFEGEGAITRTVRHNRWGEEIRYYTLKVGMTDEDVVRKIGKVTGYDHVRGPYLPRGGKKPAWVWECQHRSEVERILRAIRSHLGERRGDKADEVFAYYKEREALATRRKAKCRAGHDLTIANATYVDAKGSTMCRLCRNDWARAYKQRKGRV